MVSQIFYENLLQSGKLKNDDMESPLKWYDINGKEELYDSSYYNMDEIEIIDKLLRKLGNEYNKNNKNNIIIMSPYNSQIDKINECIKNKYPEKNIKIGTIDSSQGSEYDIVIVSLVRSNDKHNVGFLHDKKRLCVMLSRAKKELWMVGNYSTFSGVRSKKQISIWCDILSHFTLIKNFNKNKIKLLDYL
jgi:DNA polymerase alpha-associated DNA helicase A